MIQIERRVTRAILINKDGKVLLGRRANGTSKGQWELIGGKPHANEITKDAVKREVFEEIGIDFDPTFYLERLDVSSNKDGPWLVYYFVGYIAHAPNCIKRDEISEIVFVSEEDVKNFDIAFDHREILKDFFKRK